MKHAGPDTLETLDSVLRQLRKRQLLIERRPGSFYVRSKAFLHFHEDPAGIFADMKEDLRTFTRYRVTTSVEQRKLLSRVERCLKGLKAAASERVK